VVDPWQLLDLSMDKERQLDGSIENTATLFLAGAECPFTCVFCDLWRWTLDSATPEGAIGSQVEQGLNRLAADAASVTTLKLYNASNFFVDQAVPPNDRRLIGDQLSDQRRVTVECHPRLIGNTVFDFRRRLQGDLEVAMGLETVEPRAVSRLNKEMTLEAFDRATDALLSNGVTVRAFALIGVPYLSTEQGRQLHDTELDWIERTVDHAASLGIARLSLIPVRVGNGILQHLHKVGEWSPPTLELAERALEQNVTRRDLVVSLDCWQLDQLASCDTCFEDRRQRLEEMNLSGDLKPQVACSSCGAGNYD